VVAAVRIGKPPGGSVILNVPRQHLNQLLDFLLTLARGRFCLVRRHPRRDNMHRCIDHHVWRKLFHAYGANHPGDAALRNFYNLGFWLIALLHDTLFRFVTQRHPTPSLRGGSLDTHHHFFAISLGAPA
jgi:hypothetical protein